MKIPNGAVELPATGLYEFGNFRLDAGKRLLEHADGSVVPLTPRVFDTLLVLVHHAGEILTKDRLMTAIWADVIVEENNLNKNISTLRRVLGETPDSHQYIVTLPGRGYRFVAEVRKGSANDDEGQPNWNSPSASPVTRPVEALTNEPVTARSFGWPRLIAIGLVTALLMTAGVLLLVRGRSNRSAEMARAQSDRFSLSPSASRPTRNQDAYLIYLRGREIDLPGQAPALAEAAMRFYQQAVDLDPAFALAHARLSLCASQLFNAIAAPELKEKARTEAEEALRLQPDLGEAQLALTHYYLWGENNDTRAETELARAARLLPNSADVPLTAAYIYKRRNKFRDRVAALARAQALDPRNVAVLGFSLNTQRWLRHWTEAMETHDRLEKVAPNRAFPSKWLRASDEFRLTGDIHVLKKGIEDDAKANIPVHPDFQKVARYETALFERRFHEAANILADIPSEIFREENYPLCAHPKIFHQALLNVASDGDAAARKELLKRARNDAATRLVGSKDMAANTAHAEFALLSAFLGEKENAIKEARLAVDLAPLGTIERNELSAALAMVYAQTGELEEAVDLIEKLLTLPAILQRGAVYNLTLTDLKFRWQWDPLRGHPRFRKILAAAEPVTIY